MAQDRDVSWAIRLVSLVIVISHRAVVPSYRGAGRYRRRKKKPPKKGAAVVVRIKNLLQKKMTIEKNLT
jgi:hypothetical protein